MKKSVIAWILAILMIVGVAPMGGGIVPQLVAKASGNSKVLNADQLPIQTVTKDTTYGDFTITANVAIDANNKIATDGMKFTQRIKLGGKGTATERSIHQTVV